MQRMTCLSLGLGCLLLPLGGCPSTAPLTDGGGLDAGPDGGSDAGPSVMDGGSDGGGDGGLDGGSDAGTDAGVDGGLSDGGTCTIAGVIYRNSANDPSNLARCCSPLTNATGWTPRLQLTGSLPLIPGANGDGLTAADLNGDGWTDILVLDADGSTLGVFINQQGVFQPIVTYATDMQPRGIAVGDLDGDGNPDVVVVNSTSLTLGVFMGRGDGTLANQVTYPMDGPSARIVMADFDGDGVLDVAAAVLAPTMISVFHGIGDGGLAPGPSFPLDEEPFDLVTGSLHGSGNHDLAATLGNRVAVLLEYGDGGFATSYTGDAGSQLIAMTTGDWNSDGHVDIAIGTSDDAGVGLLLGNGAGIFASAVSLNLGPAAFPTMVDMDADGTTDLMFEAGPVYVLWQNPDGSQSDSVELTPVDAGFMYFPIVADFNHDRAPDVAALNGGFQSYVLVYVNACP